MEGRLKYCTYRPRITLTKHTILSSEDSAKYTGHSAECDTLPKEDSTIDDTQGLPITKECLERIFLTLLC
jgi:hypothetical protein